MSVLPSTPQSSEAPETEALKLYNIMTDAQMSALDTWLNLGWLTERSEGFAGQDE